VPNNAINNKGSHLSPLRISSNSSSIYSTNNRSPYNRDLNYSNNNLLKVNNNVINSNNQNNQNNGNSFIPSNGHRRLNHYPSNNSLHSEGGHSSNSNSASPIPSPSPSQNSMTYRAVTPTASPRHTPQHNNRSHSASTSNLISMRKWSASQEFRGNNLDIANKYVLYVRFIITFITGQAFNKYDFFVLLFHLTTPASNLYIIALTHHVI